ARAGKHVVVEKPMDVTLEQADSLIAACRAADVRLSVVSQFRFLDAVVRTREAVAAGRFGRLTLGSAYVKWHRPQSYYDSAAWRGTWALDGGGCLINQSIHAIDQLVHLCGPVARVQAATATLAHAVEVEDVAAAALTFAHGGLGHVLGTTAAFPGQAARLELHGTRGTVCLDLGGRVRLWEFADEQGEPGTWGRAVQEADVVTVRVEGAADPKAISVENHRRQFADVAEAIRDGRAPFVSGEEGRKALAVILAIYRSAREGREVAVDG
ncbi:MAG: Gfo/Idh/MocA family oxidoreductase, partial [bacterium]